MTVASTRPAWWPARWDALGVALSLGCAVHCLAVPVLLAAGTAWAGLSGLHGWLAAALVPVAALAAVPGWRRHRRPAAPLLIGGGLVLVLAALAVPEAAETPTTLAGSALLVAGHLANARLRPCPARP